MGARDVIVPVTIGRANGITGVLIELEQGKEVELADVSKNAGNLLTYAGQHVILYIRDQKRAAEQAISGQGNGYRFHVADCRKLKEMREANRLERYVVTTDTSGSFLVRGVNQTGARIEGYVNLLVCKFCLGELNYKGYRRRPSRTRDDAVRQFELAEFFRVYSSYFESLPRRSANDRAPDYGPQWAEISEQYRAEKNWRCEHCGVDLHARRALLHVHHLNRDPSDHSRRNLRALCVDCHSKQGGHEAMYVSKETKRTLAHLRNEQNISASIARRSPEVAAWKGVTDIADEACHGLLDLLREHDASAVDQWMVHGRRPSGVPEVGKEFMDDASVRAMAELAWEADKVAVVLEKGDDSRWLESEGWRVFTVGDAIASWFS